MSYCGHRLVVRSSLKSSHVTFKHITSMDLCVRDLTASSQRKLSNVPFFTTLRLFSFIALRYDHPASVSRVSRLDRDVIASNQTHCTCRHVFQPFCRAHPHGNQDRLKVPKPISNSTPATSLVIRESNTVYHGASVVETKCAVLAAAVVQ